MNPIWIRWWAVGRCTGLVRVTGVEARNPTPGPAPTEFTIRRGSTACVVPLYKNTPQSDPRSLPVIQLGTAGGGGGLTRKASVQITVALGLPGLVNVLAPTVT